MEVGEKTTSKEDNRQKRGTEKKNKRRRRMDIRVATRSKWRRQRVKPKSRSREKGREQKGTKDPDQHLCSPALSSVSLILAFFASILDRRCLPELSSLIGLSPPFLLLFSPWTSELPQ